MSTQAQTLLIIAAVGALQLWVFVRNWFRMATLRNIFRRADSWRVLKDANGLVSGIEGEGNRVYQEIQHAINQYLSNNRGSVIDFQLLKDAVDRHFNSIEEDINAQSPVPIVFGLGGTMLGVIVGLSTFDINTILSSQPATPEASIQMDEAVHNVDNLLGGIAIAMGTSICGIVLTLVGSLLYKHTKQRAEQGKNRFLAWMQAELLPALPTDTSKALVQLVHNLNAFNTTFQENTAHLGSTLGQINEAYAVQADIVRTIKEMDINKMATANVKVLKELSASTEKLEQFNTYLSSVRGYTDAILQFHSQFNKESERLHLLEEQVSTLQWIRDFFQAELTQINQRKGAISKSTADIDDTLQKALGGLQKHSETQLQEIQTMVVDQVDGIQRLIRAQAESFEEASRRMMVAFNEQMQQMPRLADHIEAISRIPEALTRLQQSIHDSQAELHHQLLGGVQQLMQQQSQFLQQQVHHMQQAQTKAVEAVAPRLVLPRWMKWAFAAVGVIVAGKIVLDVVLLFVTPGEAAAGMP